MVTKIRRYCLFLIVLCICPFVQAQIEKSDQAWYTIYNRAVSNDGRWIFFTKSFDKGLSQGILRNTENGKELTISESKKFYLDNHYFMVIDSDQTLRVQNLVTGLIKVYENIITFEYDDQLKKIMVRRKNEVLLLHLPANKEQSFMGFDRTETLAETPCVLLHGSNGTSLLNKNNGTVTAIFGKEKVVKSAVASATTNRIKLLIKDGISYEISTIDYSGNQILTPTPPEFESDFSEHTFINENFIVGKSALKKDGYKKDTVEVWSNHDQALKPRLMNMVENAVDLELVEVKKNSFVKKSLASFSTNYYLVFDNAYILEVDELKNYDFNVSDLTPRPKISLRKRSTDTIVFEADEVRAVNPSGKGNYLLYFKGKDWYYYDLKTGGSHNITVSSGALFYHYDRLNDTIPHPIDRAYFSADYETVYLTSKNDVWKYSLQKKKLQQLTSYSDKKMSFRIKSASENSGVQRMIWTGNSVLENDEIVFHMSNIEEELEEGLAVLRKGKLTLIEEPSLRTIDQIQSSEESVTYVIRNANTPPALMLYNIASDVESKKQQTNQPLIGNRFPHTELRHWINSKGESTYTTVVLPPDYSPLKKYPAVVRIYENEAKRYKEFIYPSYHNTTGFNRALLAEQGYIVILPKITYSVNKVGESAVRSVEEAVKKMQTWYSIDEKNIGLIGHSFGGYETNYIITQSNMFKTAISGSGIANIVSDYFTVHQMYLNSNIARYTNQQFSFTGDFYHLKKEYAENNPILMADQIETPLLLWSGKDDTHVEWRQSVEMFMALASLKKEVRLVLFPNDPHVLSKKENQIEATQRINDWFGYYLKNGKKPLWY